MVSVGIDVSKGKSTVCLMRPFGEIVAGPMEITHVDSELKTLVKLMKSLSDEVKVVMEATGVYHLPVLTYLKDNDIFAAVINPYQMKQYRVQGLRRVKTDKADSMVIAKYGLDNWDDLKDFVSSEDRYRELTLLSRQYRHYNCDMLCVLFSFPLLKDCRRLCGHCSFTFRLFPLSGYSFRTYIRFARFNCSALPISGTMASADFS